MPWIVETCLISKQEQRAKIQSEIDATTTVQLDQQLNESELLQSVVLQFLQHDGYVETARAFADDIRAEKEALSLSTDDKVTGTSIKDDEDANNRQRKYLANHSVNR